MAQNEPTLIAPPRELDFSTADSFRQAVDDALGDRPRTVVVALSEVDFVDSTGLAVIFEVYERLRGSHELAIVVPPVQPPPSC